MRIVEHDPHSGDLPEPHSMPEADRRRVPSAQAPICAVCRASCGADKITAICSASGRATLTDARALSTREIQKIRKIRQGSCDAVVAISIDE